MLFDVRTACKTQIKRIDTRQSKKINSGHFTQAVLNLACGGRSYTEESTYLIESHASGLPGKYMKTALVLDEDTNKRLANLSLYGFNHSG